MKSINPTKVYERTFYECMTLKKEFWQKYSKFRGEDSDEIRSRDIIKNVFLLTFQLFTLILKFHRLLELILCHIK